ncbi:MotA/TolQ/ExbB proton channel family protein [bacterium]|nr:MotA/TolQ/ExbB proton channel family protein [bacterium]
MMTKFVTELQALFVEGGWVLWGLIALAFGIAFALISIWKSLQEISSQQLDAVDEFHFAKPRRRIPFAFVLIGAAPLIGLLGTVSGMLTTFTGLSGVTNRTPIDVISRGISEALITTQAGLIIAVPALITCTLLKNRFETLQQKAKV